MSGQLSRAARVQSLGDQKRRPSTLPILLPDHREASALPGREGGPRLACAVIVKRVGPNRSKPSLDELLRDRGK